MNNMPLLKKVLGNDWNKLPPVIQRHYQVSNESSTYLKGKMNIGFPTFLFPLIALIHLCGGLVIKRGENIETQVVKSVSSDGTALLWQRKLVTSEKQTDQFFSRMIYLKDHELQEIVRFGFGLRFKVFVEEGKLIYRSHGHIWQCRYFKLIFPDWLVLGKATIIESAVNEHQLQLNFIIRHPFWGDSYWYHGVFSE